MPGRFVFPGGVVEPEDVPPASERGLAAPPEGIDGPTRRSLATFARAALREAYEESGLLIGRPAGPRGRSGAASLWQIYGEQGLEPAPESLRLFARAITPSSYPIRFHARFFLAPEALIQGEPLSHGELEEVGWLPLRSLGDRPMPSVTRLVLRQALVWRCLTGSGQARALPRRLRARLFA